LIKLQPSTRIKELTLLSANDWELLDEVRELKNSGQKITELTIGEHDIRTDPRILDALNKSAINGNTGYAPVSGNKNLREAIANRVTKRTGIPTTYKNVIITPGGQSALFAAHLGVCNPGDVALYCDPYYATYPGTIAGTGAKPKVIKARPEENFQLSGEAIDTASDGAKSLLINSPNNPTGVVYTRDTLEDISLACKKNNLWLISDEVYDTQVWEGTHISPRSIEGMSERTIVIGSMSKSHAMTGSRIGWAVAPEEFIDHLINFATHTTYGVPGFIQDAALHGLSLGKKFENEIATPFKRRRDLATQIFSKQNLLTLVPPTGAMYLLLDVSKTGLTGKQFSSLLLAKKHIAVMPGEIFGKSALGYVRIAMTVNDAEFKNALNEIIDFTKQFL